MITRSKYALGVPLVLISSLLTAENTAPQSPTVPTPGAPAAEATANNKADGYYAGTLSSGSNAYLFITDSGDFWLLVDGRQSASDETGLEVIRGTGAINTKTFTANSSVLISPAGPPIKVDLAATYGPKSGIQGTLSTRGVAPVKFAMVYLDLYDKPYPIDTVAGRYTGIVRAGNVAEQISLDIDSSGRLNGGSSNCSVTGQARQSHPSKNPYATAIRFTGPQCGLGSDTTLAGVMTAAVNPSQAGEVSASFVGSSENADRYAFIELAQGTPGGTPPSTTASSPFGGARHQ